MHLMMAIIWDVLLFLLRLVLVFWQLGSWWFRGLSLLDRHLRRRCRCSCSRSPLWSWNLRYTPLLSHIHLLLDISNRSMCSKCSICLLLSSLSPRWWSRARLRARYRCNIVFPLWLTFQGLHEELRNPWSCHWAFWGWAWPSRSQKPFQQGKERQSNPLSQLSHQCQ